ncbi:MAG TPA: hypothetical protein VIA64_12415 [Burkholderiales bacterium]|jgi:hypothetical protein
MKTNRAVVAAALLLPSALLVSTELHAYQIIEGRYRVEVSPGVFEDQLVVRCDDGRTLTVRWETKLAEACGENLMGGPAPKAARAAPASPAPKAVQSPQADPQPKTAPEPTPAVATPAGLFDEQSQKEAMLTQVRAQFGDVPERYIEFKPGADGLSMRFLPPLSDILKKYELCRKVRETRADCGADRDRAIAKLSGSTPPAVAGSDKRAAAGTEIPAAAGAGKPAAAGAEKPAAARNDKPTAPAANAAAAPETPTPPPADKPVVAGSDKPATPAPKAVAPGEPSTPTNTSPEARPAPVQPDAASAAASDRAVAEQKIAEEYTWCMRAKPRFECEQARAKALSALDKPKPAAKPKRPAKQAAAPNVANAR